MAYGERDYLPVFGFDYDLTRWTTGKRDGEGKLIWREDLPSNRDWKKIRIVTIEFEDENGQTHYRNARISPDRPLDIYGGRKRPGEEYFYDLDDLVFNILSAYGLWGEECRSFRRLTLRAL